MSDSVLVVIDVQNGFITDASRPVVPVIADLVARWQAQGGDTVFTRYVNYSGSPYERLIGWTKNTNEPETTIVAELSPYLPSATAVLTKLVYTLFTPEGEALVREHGWRNLYLCGIDTDGCVMKTAIDAFERNLTPRVLVDASASHSGQKAQDAALYITGRLIGTAQLITTGDLLEKMEANEVIE